MRQLEPILRAAATAPGNWQRFQAAGLVTRDPGTGTIHLLEDWQAAFSRLPILDKDTVRQNPGQFLASVDDIVYRGSSSGTEGNHLIYFADSAWNQARIQARRRSLAWWGIDDLTPILNLSSRLLPVRPADVAIAGALTPELLERLLRQLTLGPAVLRGYPTRLCAIAAALTGQRVPLVLGVICTGEPVFDFQVALLQRVFAAPVIVEYGCQESGISGFTCPEAGRLHLDGDRCWYEVADGQLVTTDLWNRVMPMVRYRCGDQVDLSHDPCPCGRPGPTATLWGRTGERIRTPAGWRYPGQIAMPPLPGILTYQVIRGDNTTATLQVCPDPNQATLDLQPLQDWASTALGQLTPQVHLARPTPAPVAASAPCDLQTWLHTMTHGPWADWIHHPQFPDGEGHRVARLVYELVNPGVMQYQGLPFSTWELVQQVMNQVPSSDPALAAMTTRALLLACSQLWDDPSVEQLYQEALRRSLQIPSAHPWDMLIPTLFLPTPTALRCWATWLEQQPPSTHPPDRWAMDAFTIQHLLHGLEPAVQRGWRSPSPMFKSLRPFLSVLLGEVSLFLPMAGPWLLAHWFEQLHQQPLPASPWLEPPAEAKFARAWLTWRQQGSPLQSAAWNPLEAIAQSPAERERVVLERGYGLLVQRQTLDPQEWIPILQHREADSPDGAVDWVPWQPILRALVPSLFQQGQPDLAYDCLVMATVPSSRVSAFERVASQWNSKQPVLFDLTRPS